MKYYKNHDVNRRKKLTILYICNPGLQFAQLISFDQFILIWDKNVEIKKAYPI